MAAPGAVTLLLVLTALVPALLVSGCTWCPDGYQACGGHCWKRIQTVVPFWSAAPLCETDSINISGGDPKYIAIPSPQNKAENDCVKRFANEAAVWLGFILVDNLRLIWQDYKHQRWLHFQVEFSDWAWDQPGWWRYWGAASDELHVVLIPASWSMTTGWHDWDATGLFHPLCATRYCITP